MYDDVDTSKVLLSSRCNHTHQAFINAFGAVYGHKFLKHCNSYSASCTQDEKFELMSCALLNNFPIS